MNRQKVQITLPPDLKSLLEDKSKQEFMSVSAFIERAILYYFEKKYDSTKPKKSIDLGI